MSAQDEIIALPEGYDCATDKGQWIVEQLCEYDQPPTHVLVQTIDATHQIAILSWREPEKET